MTTILTVLSVVIVQAQDFTQTLTQHHVKLFARVNQYDTERFNLLTSRQTTELSSPQASLSVSESRWDVTRQVKPLDKPGKYEITVRFLCMAGSLPDASISVDVEVSDWSTENYVLMPGAVYNGNRYEAIRMDYMPFFSELQLSPHPKILLSDHPRLNYRDGYSRIQERSGSMSLPSVGYRSPRQKKGLWLCFSQGNTYGDYGVDVEENRARTKATLTITAPVVREVQRHFMTRMDVKPSTDKPATFRQGDSSTITFILDLFECPTIQALYDELTALRIRHYPVENKPVLIPFSAAYTIVEQRHNRENWNPEGYYGSGVNHEAIQSNWTPGWVGGMLQLYPLLVGGDTLSRRRVVQNLEWLYPRGISPSGYYYDKGGKGKFYGLKPLQLVPRDLTLVRKNAEATYYAYKLFDWLRRNGQPVKKEWEESNRTALDAQLATWEKHGQLGQFLNQLTGEIVMGNSTSAGIFPAALCAAYRYTGKPDYLSKAEAIADYFATNYVQKGLVYGGPADAVQSFDSESAYGLLEGFVELYEATGKSKWLRISEEMANQFASWVVAYDYKFPATSTFGKLGVRSAGAVYANTQNKTAPPLCAHSGIALLKLYRATGRQFYLNLLRDIVQFTPQLMSWKEHPIPGYHEGWIYERCNLNEWDNDIGETHVACSYPGVPLMLAALELPSVYVNLETAEVFAIDHIQAHLERGRKEKASLILTNPTTYEARVKILAETKVQTQKPMGMNAFLGWRTVQVPAGKSVSIELSK